MLIQINSSYLLTQKYHSRHYTFTTDRILNPKVIGIYRKPCLLSAGHTGFRPLYNQFRINFPHSVDRSNCVGVATYLCRWWARMSPVLIISNPCDSTILSNPTIWCDRRFNELRQNRSRPQILWFITNLYP